MLKLPAVIALTALSISGCSDADWATMSEVADVMTVGLTSMSGMPPPTAYATPDYGGFGEGDGDDDRDYTIRGSMLSCEVSPRPCMRNGVVLYPEY